MATVEHSMPMPKLKAVSNCKLEVGMAWDWGIWDYQYNALVSFPDCVWEPDYLQTHTWWVSIQWLTWAWPSV